MQGLQGLRSAPPPPSLLNVQPGLRYGPAGKLGGPHTYRKYFAPNQTQMLDPPMSDVTFFKIFLLIYTFVYIKVVSRYS